MPEKLDLKGIISLMYLEVITGDVHIRNQYMNTLITQVVTFLRMSKLHPRQTSIERFRTMLHNTVQMILRNYHPMNVSDPKREPEILAMVKFFDMHAIRIDEKVADVTGLDQMQLIEDIESLEYARNVCYAASTDYSNFMASLPQGLTEATNKYAYIVSLLTPIIYRYEMVDITDSAYRNAAMLATKLMEAAAKEKL